jgi:hypothetical protein
MDLLLSFKTRWRRLFSLTLCIFAPEERYPGTHQMGEWVVPRVSLDVLKRR